MRIVSALLVVLLFPAGAAAQLSGTSQAIADYENCIKEKATAFAALDGSITEIAIAATAACNTYKEALQVAYRIHYGQTVSDYDAGQRSASVTRLFATRMGELAMATVAESRLGAGS